MIRTCKALIAGILLAALAACGGGMGGSSGGGGVGGMTPPASNTPFWPQWGANPQHSGMVAIAGQNLTHQLADITYDPFVAQEQTESGGELLAHYQASVVDGSDVYVLMKTGTYKSCNPTGAWQSGSACGPNTWNTEIWNEARFTWENGTLTQIWMFQSDWKPETNGAALQGWEPVFHPIDANNFIYVPGASGAIWKVNKDTGMSVSHIAPTFTGPNPASPQNTFVAGPLIADSNGNIYYNVIQLADPSLGDPWANNDVQGAWLVKVTSQDAPSTVTYATLVPNAPPASSNGCPGTFNFLPNAASTLPWPPSTTAVAPTQVCGSQRPGVNVAPAIGADGTIYTASLAHFDALESFLVAVNPDLTPKWAASLQNRLGDGCGFIVPIGPTNSTPNACRMGANSGVDPNTNALGSGQIIDQGSSSPTVLPDGSVVFGALTFYNAFRGHLFHFDAQGNFLNAFDFGWDSTPGVYAHDGTYSIVIKDNHYDAPLYCFLSSPICQTLPAGPYFITQLDPNMNIEWQFQNTNTESCSRNANGSLTCVSDHPNSFEWCINMPAVDRNGTVYANSEDGNMYMLPQGHSGVFTQAGGNIFLNLAIGAAYTPLSIGPDGKLYTQNDGQLFVVGN
jgi:hypothetical protein